MVHLQHGAGFTHLSKTVPQMQQDSGKRSGYGMSHLELHFFLTLCLLGYGIKNAKVQNFKLIEVCIIDYLLLLVILVFVFCLVFLTFAFSIFTYNQHRFVYWVFSAITSPLIGTFIPLALLVAIHVPISAACKQHQYHNRKSQARWEEEPKTINRSDAIEIPSHTTWNPPHSSFGDVPFVQMD